MKHARALAFALALLPSVAAAQIYLPPNVGLPPQTVIGNALSQNGNAVAVTFSQLRTGMSVPALKTCSTSQWFNSLTTGGVLGCTQPSVSDIAGFGSGVATFLGTPTSANLRAALTDETGTGSAVFATGPTIVSANLGTPSALTLTNATGLPLSTGLTGAGTGVLAALGTNVGTGGSVVVNGGALGTPSSGTLTNATGLPISTGVSGLGAGCATFLGTPTSANLRGCLTDESGTGAVYFQGGDIGTPSAGVATNLTGTAAGLTAGTFSAGSASNLTSGTLPAARTNGHMNGTATNDSAAAGEVGQEIESIVSLGAAVSLTTGTPANVTNISLTAGDWDVTGAIGFIPGASTSVTQFIASNSTTSATLDTTPGRFFSFNLAAYVPGAAQQNYAVPVSRFSLSSTTTVYLVAQSAFTVSTMGGFGIIRARRVR